uniref:G-protein coupled receptors family 1 profile domain-containing protein n=1 Tax=Stomoxys calcitrans TaxID=35570 RepID=A0A1I8PMA8_STOCA
MVLRDSMRQHQNMNNLQQTMIAVVTESVAAVMAPTMNDNNLYHRTSVPANASTSPADSSTHGANNHTEYSYDISAAGLLYWSGDGGGGGVNGVAELGSDNSIARDSSSEIIIDSLSNSFKYLNASAYAHDPNDTDFYMHCMDRDPVTNLSYFNLTCETQIEYVLPLYGYIMPFLLVLTVLSNSLIVLILSKKNMSTPTNFVLMGMAIFDMLTVIFPAPGLIYMYTFGNHYKPLHPTSLCRAYIIFVDILPAICHTASIWLTLALAVQRYIYVCHAPMARTWCTIPRVKRCTLYIAIAAFLHQSTRMIDRSYEPLTIEWNGEMVEVCHLETADWVHELIGEDLYFSTFYLFRVFFVNLLPCVMLVTLNILLFSAMRKAQERRKLLFSENRKKECKKLRESNCTTLMLIVVVSVFLAVEIPIAVVTVMHIVSSLAYQFLDYSIANVFVTATNFALVVSYPINFGIYCGMSRQFRETFKSIFLGRMVGKKDNSSRYSIVNGPRTCTNTNETVL